MSGVANRSGPPGNDNAAEGKRWTAAIVRAIERKGGKPHDDPDFRNAFMRGIDRLADDFIASLPQEGTQGYREVGDRLDGRAPQSVDAKLSGGVAVYATPLDEKI